MAGLNAFFRSETAQQVREVRALARELLLRAVAGTVPQRQRELKPAANVVQALVAEGRLGAWRVVHFQKTPVQYHGRPELSEAHTQELRRVLTGSEE